MTAGFIVPIVRRATSKANLMTTSNQCVRLFCACLISLFVSWPTDASSSPKIVVIDPGHGGGADAGSDAARNKSTNNNATSATLHLKEKDLALTLSKLIAERIDKSEAAAQGKIKAVLTRRDDSNLDFAKRAGVAAQANGSCYVAIHFNSDNSQRVSGPRAVIQQRSRNPNYETDEAFGRALARAVEKVSKTFRPQTPAASVHDDHELHNGWGSYLFHQLSLNPKTKLIPSCHLEVEFLDNRDLEHLFFVDRKDEIFAAWASAIANELIRQTLAAE
jgi:N-acetylmuramoyl-L-alanine amidase